MESTEYKFPELNLKVPKTREMKRKEALIHCLKEIIEKFIDCIPCSQDDFPLFIVVSDENDNKYTEEQLINAVRCSYSCLQTFIKSGHYGDGSDEFHACLRCLDRLVWEGLNSGTENAPRLMYEKPPYVRMYFRDWNNS